MEHSYIMLFQVYFGTAALEGDLAISSKVEENISLSVILLVDKQKLQLNRSLCINMSKPC